MIARQLPLKITAMLLLTQWCGCQINSAPQLRQISGNAGAAPADGKVEITEDEARKLAEEFIVRNGYTDIPPVDDAEIVFETLDAADRVEALRLRANTLEATAYAVHRGPDRWLVIFRYNAASALRHTTPEFAGYVKSRGRALIMDLSGQGLHMAHQDIIL